jgi:hypothetical protein
MTTMTTDACERLGILADFDRIFREPARMLAERPPPADDDEPDPEAPAQPVNQQDEE